MTRAASPRERDQLVTFESPGGARGSAGGVVRDWKDVGQAWVKKTDVGGTEQIRGAQAVAQATTLWDGEYSDLSMITTLHRLRADDGTYHEILYIRDIGTREGRQLQTKSVKNAKP